MGVQVSDTLADRVVHRHERPVDCERLGNRRGNSLNPFEVWADQRSRQIGERDHMRARDDQHVPLEHRGMVEKGDGHLVGKHDIDRDLARCDLAE